MEKKFYTDNFEQFLKETADDFRMYPSKRVWNSLYNNLHPGRKWPSIAVWLLLISSIVFVGITNKEDVSGRKSIASTNINPGKSMIAAVPTSLPGSSTALNNSPVTDLNSSSNNNLPSAINTIQQQQRSAFNVSGSQEEQHNVRVARKTNKRSRSTNGIQSIDVIEPSLITDENSQVTYTAGTELTDQEIKDASLDAEENFLATSIASKIVKLNKVNSLKISSNNTNTEKEWIEDFAFHNKPSSKWKSRLAYQLYATPSVGYRSLSKNTHVATPPSASSLLSSGQSNGMAASNELKHRAGFNLEAGGSLIYSFSKIIRLKAGLQLNYTNYRIHAYHMNHPTSTSLLFTNTSTGSPEIITRSSYLSNTLIGEDATNKKLNSNTYQVSIPVGADFKIAGKENIQWYAGATIQPSFIVGGNGYLVSTDTKNYVYDASVLRKWNINAGIETFLSYKLNNGIILNAGPQLRYQFLSTYDKNYSYDEKLYNIGVKMGITRNF
ncbi:MAG TPA: outer membrane beta-barrel protein [Ferruginibacter sp.]|nr:outer membrane beta-barrel protein [Ferruginibacter sp.]